MLPIEELMATLTEPVAPVLTVERRGRGKVVVSCLTTTDRKNIGHLCLITSFGFFLIAVPTGVKFLVQHWLDAEGHKGDRR
ncbi:MULTISPECIES: hypothetical protein [Streptomyces]|uniref:Uncharacterized protein n=2 Tax=Streptomyces TaxID=1883 RepID=A0AA89TM09_STRCU|nr:MULTISPECIES: hypothetical protein [Streptomyces]MBB5816357.1 hypothetical protein [Streptomyces collinus]MEC7051936.1 hypothetical protein [Streptomyces violaceochromogenes]WMX62350.1 hypothetical protein RFN52_02850 [Streptomyces collinus]GHC91709.1 hypothetical protein GCM10010309_74490 [Streptomyces violaceochromogenes]